MTDRLAEIEERWAIRPEWVRDAREWDSEIEWLITEVKRLRDICESTPRNKERTP